MRTLFFACGLLLIGTCSCTSGARENDNPNTQAPPAPPAPLQEDRKSGLKLSKRGAGDLVDELFSDLQKSEPALQDLENNIGNASEQKQDSTSPFFSYDGKNNSYYSSAGNHMNTISDSALKQKVNTLITNSLALYQNRTQAHKQLIAQLEIKNTRLDDLFTVLKLVRTLAIIDRFQQDQLPSVRPLQSVSREYDRLIAETQAH
jgi:hypothetical protein